MPTTDILRRLARIYASLAATVECDLRKFPPTVSADGRSLSQEFSGGLSPADLENIVHTVIYNLSHLEGHLKRWARKQGKPTAAIDETIENSFALRVLMDLSNADKHGGSERGGGHSKRDPRIVEIRRGLQLSTGGFHGSHIQLTVSPQGPQIFTDGGSAEVVISADVIDGSGAALGSLDTLEVQALDAWDDLLRRFGIL